MAKGGFFILSNTLSPALLALNPYTQVEEGLDDFRDLIREYAQTTAPWEDRTGAAREGLEVDIRIEGTDVILELSHGVDYGLYLETKNSGEFAVIMPTLEAFSGPVFAALGVTSTGEDLMR